MIPETRPICFQAAVAQSGVGWIAPRTIYLSPFAPAFQVSTTFFPTQVACNLLGGTSDSALSELRLIAAAERKIAVALGTRCPASAKTITPTKPIQSHTCRDLILFPLAQARRACRHVTTRSFSHSAVSNTSGIHTSKSVPTDCAAK